jgi:predicted RNA-binding protein associated with RNAse of E/G family
MLHEVVHELKISKSKGLILKIDFEKAYDKVRRDFLELVMKRKGFPSQWINWVMQMV